MSSYFPKTWPLSYIENHPDIRRIKQYRYLHQNKIIAEGHIRSTYLETDNNIKLLGGLSWFNWPNIGCNFCYSSKHFVRCPFSMENHRRRLDRYNALHGSIGSLESQNQRTNGPVTNGPVNAELIYRLNVNT